MLKADASSVEKEVTDKVSAKREDLAEAEETTLTTEEAHPEDGIQALSLTDPEEEEDLHPVTVTETEREEEDTLTLRIEIREEEETLGPTREEGTIEREVLRDLQTALEDDLLIEEASQ